MSYNGSGVWTANSTGLPVVTASVISITMFNAFTLDVAAGLTTAYTKDGQSTPSNNLPMGGFRLTGLGVAIASGDALSYGQAANVSALTVGTLAGLIKGTAGLFSAATAGTDYAKPDTASTWSAKQTFNGAAASLAMAVKNASEPVTISATAATGTIAYNVLTQSVLYYTSNAAANWTVNVRGDGSNTLASLMATGDVVTVTFMVTNGASPFYNTTLQIDGTATGVTTKWQGGAPAAGYPSGIDVYTYAITKTAATPTYTVLASVTQFL